DLATGTVREEQRSDVGFELPRVDERVVGRRHRVAYGTEVAHGEGGNAFGGRLVRVDGRSVDVALVDLGPGRIGGEWVMVPRHPGADEDDGWLLSFVYDAATDRSELVVLPAADPTAGPEARVLLPNRVPAGFHGSWVPDAG
ncbi:MAG TPA: carotenoid oxygenase family protein, partial [Acidimicrobiales bacterium]|nr:carotenoid oxygenase family protein [Acidimicrobiales bacterium]